jgi:hypothetical protein
MMIRSPSPARATISSSVSRPVGCHTVSLSGMLSGHTNDGNSFISAVLHSRSSQ